MLAAESNCRAGRSWIASRCPADRAAADAQTAADRVATAYAMLVRQRSREALGALEDPSLQRDGAGDILSRRSYPGPSRDRRPRPSAAGRSGVAATRGGMLPVAAYVARHGKQPDDHRRLVRIAGADGVFALLQGLGDRPGAVRPRRAFTPASVVEPSRPQEAASARRSLAHRVNRAREGWLEAERSLPG